MSIEKPFTKENVEMFLKELAKEFRKRNGRKTPAEIILVGGASILINYGFRVMTYDMDAIIQSSSAMKESINAVADKMGLPDGWLNTDFIFTNSYSKKIVEHSKYYKTFSNILQIRTISSEYLIAMKLMAGRQYKNDMSDIVGIMMEELNNGKNITLDMIKEAFEELYDSYEKMPEDSQRFIESVFAQKSLKQYYMECREEETEKNALLKRYVTINPEGLRGKSANDVLKEAKKMQGEDFSETNSFDPLDTLNLILESKSDEEKELYAEMANSSLKRRQKDVIKRNLF